MDNDQTGLPSLDLDRLRNTASRIRRLLGYETYDVSILLVDDEEMIETNFETRGKNCPTDILSFPFHECRENEPGMLVEPEFDIPDYYTLGDMMVDVPYVIRRCLEDQQDHQDEEKKKKKKEEDDGLLPSPASYESDDDDERDDRGVSAAMATVYDAETRLHMLLVHGMLHLVGHDHETDRDYKLMVSKEEELLQALGL